MPGFDAPPPSTVKEPVSLWNTRLGLVLFVLYLAFYVAFVFLSAFWPESLDVMVAGGVNLGVVYGFGLIASAFLLALLYAWLCRPALDDQERPVTP